MRFRMKKIFFITAAVILIFGGLAGVSLVWTGSAEGESVEATVTKEVKNEETHSCCSTEKEAGEYTENSVYQLESEWINQDKDKVMLSAFMGKKVVFTMFFASCTYACPILVEDMKRIESEIPAEELDDYKFVLISIDPERDTPEKLKEFATIRSIDLNRWTLLTGKEDDIMELAAITGFKYKKESDGQFSHSNIINILNEEGEVLFQHQGLNQDVTLAANYLTKE
jgi:protein SCO1